MTRRRYVFVHGELVEVSPDYGARTPPDSGALWGDRSYAGLRASDGTPIDTRSKHREYMKTRGLTTMDDFKNEWAKAAEQRGKPIADPERKQLVADVVYGRMPFTKARREEW